MIPSSTLLIESVQKWEGVAVLPEETKAKVGLLYTIRTYLVIYIYFSRGLSGYSSPFSRSLNAVANIIISLLYPTIRFHQQEAFVHNRPSIINSENPVGNCVHITICRPPQDLTYFVISDRSVFTTVYNKHTKIKPSRNRI